MGFAGYFLIVVDYIKAAKQMGVLVGQVEVRLRLHSILLHWNYQCRTIDINYFLRDFKS